MSEHSHLREFGLTVTTLLSHSEFKLLNYSCGVVGCVMSIETRMFTVRGRGGSQNFKIDAALVYNNQPVL